MDVFPRVFLLVFCEFAVGGLFCLSLPPFHVIERGYYKSSAFVFVLMGVLALAGRLALWWNGGASPAQRVEILLWALFVVSSGGYLVTLWGERYRLRARLFTAGWLTGAAALTAFAEGYRAAPLLSLETLIFPASFLLSALVIGSAATGMLLGHWYLIDRDLPLDPLWLTVRLYRGCLALQLVLLLAAPALLAVAGVATTRAAVAALFADHRVLLLTRAAVSPLAALALGWMIDRTLRVPQTMAATGLFYIAVLAVMVGELLGRFLLFRTGLPL